MRRYAADIICCNKEKDLHNLATQTKEKAFGGMGGGTVWGGGGLEGRGVYRNVPLLPINLLVQTRAAQQFHDLTLLVRLHASEGHAVLHHCFHQPIVWLLQQVLECRPGHAALHSALHTTAHLLCC